MVYPSTKKKNPKNEKNGGTADHTPQLTATSLQGLGGLLKKGGSNTSSTHSLLVLHSNPAETPREGVFFNVGNISSSQGRKSLVLETDSGRKKQCNTARLNSSQTNLNPTDLSSQSGLVP